MSFCAPALGQLQVLWYLRSPAHVSTVGMAMTREL